tara:strand:- start:134 stop:343 length:210 start_codon:yes stop_codon:yes gene_type:complete
MASRAFTSANRLLQTERTLESGSIVFRTNSQVLTDNTTIDEGVNALVAGPITINSNTVTLTVKGNLSIV